MVTPNPNNPLVQGIDKHINHHKKERIALIIQWVILHVVQVALYIIILKLQDATENNAFLGTNTVIFLWVMQFAGLILIWRWSFDTFSKYRLTIKWLKEHMAELEAAKVPVQEFSDKIVREMTEIFKMPESKGDEK